MGLALLYTLLVLLAPTDADGAFFKGVSSQQSFSVSPRVDRPPRLWAWMFSAGAWR